MKAQNRYKNLLIALVAIAGASAISANASTNGSIQVAVENQEKIQQVMSLASSMGFDYTIRPKLSESGEFQAGIVEISVSDQVSYVALRNMIAN